LTSMPSTASSSVGFARSMPPRMARLVAGISCDVGPVGRVLVRAAVGERDRYTPAELVGERQSPLLILATVLVPIVILAGLAFAP
jgi:hypothetical protein